MVVGAGVTGLGAARRLAELDPEARVILLEEYRVGYGASALPLGPAAPVVPPEPRTDPEAEERFGR